MWDFPHTSNFRFESVDYQNGDLFYPTIIYQIHNEYITYNIYPFQASRDCFAYNGLYITMQASITNWGYSKWIVD